MLGKEEYGQAVSWDTKLGGMQDTGKQKVQLTKGRGTTPPLGGTIDKNLDDGNEMGLGEDKCLNPSNS